MSTNLGVIDVLFGPVAAESIAGNFKFLGPIAKAHEAKYPEQDANGLCRHILDRADVDGLRVISQPVTEVYALDVHLAELLAGATADKECEKGIFNISMAPILSLDRAQAGNIACTKGCGGTRPKHK